MSADRPLFERGALAAATTLLAFGVGCASAEPTRAQAPTPPQGVTSEIGPPLSVPESPSVEQPQVAEPQIEDCQPTDFRGPIGSETTPFTRFRVSNEMRLRSGPALAAPEVIIVARGDSIEIVCMRPQIQEGRIIVTSLFKEPNSPNVSGWGEPGEPRIEELMLRAVRAKTPEPVVEIPYQMYGVYSGDLFVADGNPKPRGGLVVAPLPAPVNKIFVHYDVYRVCGSDPQERFSRDFLADFRTIRGRGFSQDDGLGNVITAALIREGVMAGNIQFKDNVPPGCKGEFFSFSNLELKGEDRAVLGQELVASFKKIGGGENPPEDLLKIVENRIGVSLPIKGK